MTKKFYQRLVAFVFLSGIIAVTSSCNDPEIIGIDIQPPGDKINLVYSDTASITAYTVREDSLRTDETSLQLLGSYMDPVFGRSDAAIYAQVVPPTSIVDTLDTPGADSLVLTLAYNGYYGDTSTPQTFHVYQINEDMSYDAAYYSNKIFSDTVELGSATIIPAPTDSITVYGVKTAPHLRININNTSLGDSLLNLFGHTELASTANFLAYFNGLHIKVDSAISGGAVLYFNLLATQSKMTLYYHTATTDSLKYDFAFSNIAARMTHFNHDYTTTSTAVGAQLNDSTNGDSLVYVQSMAGVKTKIRFPHITDYITDGMIAVNKAEVEITLSDNNPDTLSPPSKLLLLAVDSVGGALFLPDQFEGSFYYGGDYNSTTKKYKFNIARYLQNIITGATKDYGLYLAVSGGSIQGNRAIICGGDTSSVHKMKLNLTYTKPN